MSLNGNRSLAALLIAVNVMLAGGLLAWANARLLQLEAATLANAAAISSCRAEVAGLNSTLAVRVEKANDDHRAYERRLDRLEDRRAR